MRSSIYCRSAARSAEKKILLYDGGEKKFDTLRIKRVHKVMVIVTNTSKKRYKQLTKLLFVVVVGPNQEAVVGVGSSSGSGHHHPNQKLALKMEFIESNAV